MTLSSIPAYDKGQTAQCHDQAVVLGSGVAGLCAARVLSDYFSRVVVLERDELPESPRPRRGVPQGPHAHTLFPAGSKILNDLLPGYGDDLIAAGGLTNDSGSDWNYHYSGGGVRADIPNEISIYNATRPLFEQVLRRRVAELSGVEIRSPIQFSRYVTSGNGSAIAGVRVRNETGEEEVVAAELVVDAMGRSTKTPRWLENHGYSAPPTQELSVDLAYSTGTIERPPDDIRGIIVENGGQSVGLTPVEDHRWQFWLTGRGDNHPPTEPDAMKRIAEGFDVPTVTKVLDDNDWRDRDVAHYRFPSNLRYHYEDLNRFPDGLVVVGDAIASFNPVFGQGMTVAILEGLVLHHVLANQDLSGLGSRFFQRTKSVIDTPWFMVTAVDSTYSSSSGPSPPGADSYLEYQAEVRQAATEDGEVAEALVRMGQLERPLSSLLQPRILHRVFDELDSGLQGKGESLAWVPSSLGDVGPLLEEKLDNPKDILEWPSVPSE